MSRGPLVLLFLLIFIGESFAELYNLQGLYKKALDLSERVKIAEDDLYQRERDKEKAFSAFLPKITLSGFYTRYTEDKMSPIGAVIQPKEGRLWGMRLEQNLYAGGRIRTALRIAGEGIETGKKSLNLTRGNLLFLVDLAYYDMLKAKKGVDINRAEVDLTRAENALKIAREFLIRLTGIEKDFELEEGISRWQLPSRIDVLKKMAIENREDYRLALSQKRIAEERWIKTCLPYL